MTTSMVGLRMVTYAQISPKLMNPRNIAGNTEKEEEGTSLTNQEIPSRSQWCKNMTAALPVMSQSFHLAFAGILVCH